MRASQRATMVGLDIFARRDFAAELVDVGQRLTVAGNKAVGLRKQLVLNADAGNAALFKLTHQTAHVVEVPVAGVAIKEDWDLRDVGHELSHVDHLRPAGFVVVAHAQLGRDREPARPNPLKTGFLDDARAQPVMSFEQKLELKRGNQLT